VDGSAAINGDKDRDTKRGARECARASKKVKGTMLAELTATVG
jgi:hypothetical protein